MVDIESSIQRPDAVWRAFGQRLAAGVGALSALLSLLAGAAVSTACLRGAVALFGVLALTRLGSAAMAGIEAAETRASEREGEDAETSEEAKA